MMKNIGNRGSIKGFFWLIVLVALVFVGISFGKPYYRYYALGSNTLDFLKTDIGDIEAVRKHVIKDAVDLQVPLDEKDLEVVKVEKTIKVKATWSETVDFWGYYQKKIDFVMEEEL
jgi:hypothetical protein